MHGEPLRCRAQKIVRPFQKHGISCRVESFRQQGSHGERRCPGRKHSLQRKPECGVQVSRGRYPVSSQLSTPGTLRVRDNAAPFRKLAERGQRVREDRGLKWRLPPDTVGPARPPHFLPARGLLRTGAREERPERAETRPEGRRKTARRFPVRRNLSTWMQ